MKTAENTRDIALPGVVEPEYGFYPGLASFSEVYGASDYRDWVDQSNGDPVPAPLVIYIQDPVEKFSGSVRSEMKRSSVISESVSRELQFQGQLFDPDRTVQQLICSGSMTIEWTDEQLYQLVSAVQKSFLITLSGLANWCVCFDTLLPDENRLHLFRVLGFNNVRMSLVAGVNNKCKLLEAVAGLARELGYLQVAFDLLCDVWQGKQSIQWMESLLSNAQPDRIRLVVADHDSRQAYVDQLVASGYQSVGLDWFVRPDNQWWVCKYSGQLHWSPLGYTDMPRHDVIGIGPGAVSSVGDAYSQNESRVTEYQEILQKGELPIVRGLELEAGDILRREIMVMILTIGRISIRLIEEKWGIQFAQFFSYEMGQLQRLQQAGLVAMQGGDISVHTTSRSGLSTVCRIFDLRQRTTSRNPVLSTI